VPLLNFEEQDTDADVLDWEDEGSFYLTIPDSSESHQYVSQKMVFVKPEQFTNVMEIKGLPKLGMAKFRENDAAFENAFKRFTVETEDT